LGRGIKIIFDIHINSKVKNGKYNNRKNVQFWEMGHISECWTLGKAKGQRYGKAKVQNTMFLVIKLVSQTMVIK
jgi:hypothetical protein